MAPHSSSAGSVCPVLQIELPHAIAQAARHVGLDVAIPGRCHAVSPGDDLLDRPAVAACPAGLGNRLGTRFARLLAAELQHVGRRDARVGVDRVVAVEVQAQEDRAWTVGFLGEIDEQIDLRSLAVRRKVNRDFFADGRAAQGVAIDRAGLGPATPWACRGALP